MGFFATTTTSLLVLAAAAVVVVGPGSAAPSAPPAGTTCECARTGTAGRCLAFTSITPGSAPQSGRCKTVTGSDCRRPFECTSNSKVATHACRSVTVKSTLRCTDGTTHGDCACAVFGVDDTTLVPVQKVGDGRGGGGGKGDGGDGALVPPPQQPACRTAHAAISVYDKPWKCVAPMDIGSRTSAAAYAYAGYRQHGWGTMDDFINLNLLRDDDARLYLCVTYGSAATSSRPDDKRSASSVVTSTSGAPNRFYFQDDPAQSGGTGGGDSYSPAGGDAAATLTASHKWKDHMTDGYCVDVVDGLTVDFTGLELVKGLAVGKGGTVYDRKPRAKRAGGWALWRMQRKTQTNRLAYDQDGRVKAVQPRRYGPQQAAAIKVSIKPTCSC